MNDLKIYTSRMEKGLVDKLFFLNEINSSEPFVFVDFGCANGIMLEEMRKIYGKKAILVGIDNSCDMLALAEERLGRYDGKTFFFSNFSDFISRFTLDTERPIYLNMSSVLHEVYSYLDKEEIDTLMSDIFSGIFSKIFIRDMEFDSPVSETPEDEEFLLRAMYPNMLSDFEKVHGSIGNYRNFVHFLLKFRYKENWERECRENYFSEYTFYDIAEEKYEKKQEKYILPYFFNDILKTFGFRIQGCTHTKIIFSRKA